MQCMCLSLVLHVKKSLDVKNDFLDGNMGDLEC
jgi:hypothetical protein